MNLLGRHSARIESEYLERLHKVRFGMDHGWRPPGLLMKGGTVEQRCQALQRLKLLAEQDRFFCSHVTLKPDLPLRDASRVCQAAIEAAGLAQHCNAAATPPDEVKRLAGSARELGRNGWIVLIDNVNIFQGSTRERAESYRELSRWMGRPPGDSCLGLFCVLAVTPEFERAVMQPDGDLAAIRNQLASTGSADDLRLLDDAEAGIAALEHEAMVYELLVLEW